MMMGGGQYDNAIFAFHGNAQGQTDPTIQSLFGPSSPIQPVVRANLTGNGVVIYSTCFGVVSFTDSYLNAMANLYNMPVLTGSEGPIQERPSQLTPTGPDPSTGKPTPYSGFWNITWP